MRVVSAASSRMTEQGGMTLGMVIYNPEYSWQRDQSFLQAVVDDLAHSRRVIRDGWIMESPDA